MVMSKLGIFVNSFGLVMSIMGLVFPIKNGIHDSVMLVLFITLFAFTGLNLAALIIAIIDYLKDDKNV